MNAGLRFGPTPMELIANWARHAHVPEHANAIVLRPTRDEKLEVLYVVNTRRVGIGIERIEPLFAEMHTVMPCSFHSLRHEYGLRIYIARLVMEGWAVWPIRGRGPDLIAVRGKTIMAVEYSHGGFAEKGRSRLSKLDRLTYRIARRAGMLTRHVRYKPRNRGTSVAKSVYQTFDVAGAK